MPLIFVQETRRILARECRLANFLLEGSLGGVRLGMSETEALAMLGEPDDTSLRRGRKKPFICRFGALQVTFKDDRLVLIGLYAGDAERGLPRRLGMSLPEWFGRGRVNRPEELMATLRAEGIPCELEPRLTFEDQTTVIAKGSNAHIMFNVDQQGSSTLHSIQLA